MAMLFIGGDFMEKEKCLINKVFKTNAIRTFDMRGIMYKKDNDIIIG